MEMAMDFTPDEWECIEDDTEDSADWPDDMCGEDE